jgi:hypothetical protein
MTDSFLTKARRTFHDTLFENDILSVDGEVASNADRSSPRSKAIALGIVRKLDAEVKGEKLKLAGQTAGHSFEAACKEFVDTTFRKLDHIRPGSWVISQGKLAISQFDQYSHLAALSKLAESNIELAAALGSDYLIKPDIVIGRHPELDERFNDAKDVPPGDYLDDQSGLLAPLRKRNNEQLILHASVSCKWTIRSDRSQNARSEGLNLVRNRKGRLPHIAVITGEPMPSRIASIALGTGDIDCVYHFALQELVATVNDLGLEDAADILETMIAGKRLRDIADLPVDLVV